MRAGGPAAGWGAAFVTHEVSSLAVPPTPMDPAGPGGSKGASHLTGLGLALRQRLDVREQSLPFLVPRLSKAGLAG